MHCLWEMDSDKLNEGSVNFLAHDHLTKLTHLGQNSRHICLVFLLESEVQSIKIDRRRIIGSPAIEVRYSQL